MKKILFLLAMLSFASPALAGPVPEYDIKAQCSEVASFAGGSAVIELQCRKDEEAAKARLSKVNVPAGTMRTCHEIASSMGAGSYAILEQCIKDELAAKAQLQ